MHCLGSTALAILLAFVATNDANPIKFNIGVSSSWTIPKGPVTVIIGSLEKTISPSFMAT